MLYNKNWEYSKTRQVAALAADLIEQRGHAKNVLENTSGSLCILGAIQTAANGEQKWSASTLPIAEAIEKVTKEYACPFLVYADPVCAMINWNNAPERTAGEQKWSASTLPIAEAIEKVTKEYACPFLVYADPVCAMINWNNAPERTADEVINALRSVCK